MVHGRLCRIGDGSASFRRSGHARIVGQAILFEVIRVVYEVWAVICNRSSLRHGGTASQKGPTAADWKEQIREAFDQSPSHATNYLAWSVI